MASRTIRHATITIGLVGVALHAHATDYISTELGTGILGIGAMITGMNNLGQVIGYTPSLQGFVSGPNGVGFTLLQPLDGLAAIPMAINDRGQVVGNAVGRMTSPNTYLDSHAFIADPGSASVRPLDGTAGYSYSVANGINSSGQAIGYYADAGNPKNGYVTSGTGTLSLLSITPGASASGQIAPVALNDSGRVLGSYSPPADPDDLNLGFVTAAGSTQGAPLSIIAPQAINNAGQMIGANMQYVNDRSVVFFDADGTSRLIDFHGVPGYTYGYLGGSGQYGLISPSFAHGINASGQVVGDFGNSLMQKHFVFITGASGTGVTTVDRLNFVWGTTAPAAESSFAINDAGQIAVTDRFRSRFYLISPVPEPAPAALLLSGLAVCLAGRRRALALLRQHVARRADDYCSITSAPAGGL